MSNKSPKTPSMRTPLARVRFLGASGSGTSDFWWQRVTAVGMLLLIVPVIVIVMMLLGRYSRLILDSWTRPKYAQLNGGKVVTDAAIGRRFLRYGPYAGLAFWLTLTRDWVE